MSARARATTNPTVAQESIDALLEHMRMLSAAVTQIQTGAGSMDQTQMDALVASIQGTAPVPKQPPVYARNPGQVDSSKIIDYGSAVGAKRYRYATSALSLIEFDQTTGKFPEITTSLTKRSEKSEWVSGRRSITEITVGPKTYNLFREHGQFTVEENSTHTSRCILKLTTSAQSRTLICSRLASSPRCSQEPELSSTPSTTVSRSAGCYTES